MVYRPTKNEIDEVFKLFCEVIGKRTARAWNDVGAWRLDCAIEYGGYVIQEIINDKGTVIIPLGDERLKPTELVERMRFSIRWLEQKENNHSKEV